MPIASATFLLGRRRTFRSPESRRGLPWDERGFITLDLLLPPFYLCLPAFYSMISTANFPTFPLFCACAWVVPHCLFGILLCILLGLSILPGGFMPVVVCISLFPCLHLPVQVSAHGAAPGRRAAWILRFCCRCGAAFRLPVIFYLPSLLRTCTFAQFPRAADGRPLPAAPRSTLCAALVSLKNLVYAGQHCGTAACVYLYGSC